MNCAAAIERGTRRSWPGILRGEIRGPMREMVVLNSGAAIYVAGLAPELPDAFELAREAIDSGRATERLRLLRETARG